MRIILTIFGCFLVLLSPLSAFPQPLEEHAERVVLLHGMGHGPLTMRTLKTAFEKENYPVSNLNLKLEQDSLHVIIEDAYRDIRRFSERDGKLIHFVCYSQGCLVVRGLIEQHRPPLLGRVVMLGPPNQGGEMIDYLRQRQIATFINGGRNMPSLGTLNKRSLERLIGHSAEGYELGVIAGQEEQSASPPITILPYGNRTLGPERTKLDGMKEFVTVQTHHDDLYKDDAVAAMAVMFIRTGSFVENEQPQ